MPEPKLFTDQFFHAKALQGIDIVECLRLEGSHLAAYLPDIPVMGVLLGQQPPGHEKQQRRGGTANQSHNGVVKQNDTQGCQHCEKLNDHVRQPGDGAVGHGAYIGGKPAQKIPGRVPGQGHPICGQDLIKNLCLHIIVHTDGKPGRKTGGEALKCNGSNGADYGQHTVSQKGLQLSGINGIKQVFTDHTGRQPHTHRADATQSIQHHGAPTVAAEGLDPEPILPNSFQSSAVGLLFYGSKESGTAAAVIFFHKTLLSGFAIASVQ